MYMKTRQQILNTSVSGFCGCAAAIMQLDYLEQLNQLKMPVQILVGDDDLSTPTENSVAIYNVIDGSLLTIIEHARHLSNIEQAERFNACLLDFLLSAEKAN